MPNRVATDPRLDPRIRAVFQGLPVINALGQSITWGGRNVATRAELLAEANSPKAIAAQATKSAQAQAALNLGAIAPVTGLTQTILEFRSQPDRNLAKICLLRPDSPAPLPCVYYIHGGAMAVGSCFDPIYQVWAQTVAQYGVAVALVEFRNCLVPSSLPEVAPYPAGLNDCVSGLYWLAAQAAALGLDATRLVIAGESGGGNLTIATGLRLQQAGDLGLIQGLYALCPFIGGEWPHADSPAAVANNGLWLDLHNNRAAIAYGIEALDRRDPLAWPRFATEADVRGLVKTMIVVNECDPLRDEGINFYRLLRRAGVSAQCREVKGTLHASDIMPSVCPDISHATAASLAQFCRGDGAARSA